VLIFVLITGSISYLFAHARLLSRMIFFLVTWSYIKPVQSTVLIAFFFGQFLKLC
jgi:hypothetical protein